LNIRQSAIPSTAPAWTPNSMILLAQKIGRETQYVSNIYKCYLAYKMLIEQRASEREERSRWEAVT
jgi:hypothetical protein